jgi:hypothetical protein
LSVEQILAWADAWFEGTGGWPHQESGPIPGTVDEKWRNVDRCLRRCGRGLSYPDSLARLLARERGARNHKDLPPLTVEQILGWADAYHEATGEWPKADSGPIAQAPGETWSAVEAALRDGWRGFPSGSSLPQLLAEHRGVRNDKDLPRLTKREILAWADAHRRRTGRWPTQRSGPIADAPGLTWMAVHDALSAGLRGLPRGSSLTRLLSRARGVRNIKDLPPLTEEEILAWADAHHRRTGRWPTRGSGPIRGARGETWKGVEAALRNGGRGLPRGSSLARLLRRHRAPAAPRP